MYLFLLQWRKRIAMLEGDLQDLTRAENALSLMEDNEVFGNGSIITVDQILEAVKIDDGNIDGCRNRLIKECLSCGDCYPRDQVMKPVFKS